MRAPARLLTVLALSFLFSAAVPVAAIDDPSTPGALRVKQPDGAIVELPLRHTKVAIEVTAFVARATIEQEFTNPFNEPIEAVYTFPLGNRAAVDDFELQVGDRTIRGEIRRREEARAVYVNARAAGLQAALLEQERPNIFTQSVANLEPGKTITVRLRTVETLIYERGVYRLTFPLVVGPRYIPGGSIADVAKITPPVLAPGTRSGHDVEIAVTIASGVPLGRIESPSHKTLVHLNAAGAATVRLSNDDTIPNKDFLLRWSVASEKPSVGLLAHREGADGFFTLLVQPKSDVTPDEAMPKEITFVLDTSGSMSGVPIEASKRLAAKALHALGRRDTFNLIRFAGDNEVFSKDPLPNDPNSIEEALKWLSRQQGAGGTEMLPAMQAAFARPIDPNRLRVVIFLTDGYVGNEDQILAAIGKVIGDARIYTIGIGSSVNHHLLDRMADLGRGAYVFVRPDESADDALEAFRSWVTLPYLTDLTIDWGSLPVTDVEPARLPDLGAGQTLSVVGRYINASTETIVVRGKLGGRYWEQKIRVALPERETSNAALASVWARGRIESLQRNPEPEARESVKTEVTELALTYRLMSPYTSFVAVDDSRVVNPGGNPGAVRQPLPLPEGVSMKAAGAAAEVVRAQGGIATVSFSSDYIANLPVQGNFYQNVLTLSGGIQDPDGDGNPNINGARERDFKTVVLDVASVQAVRELAFRVLADFADDGALSAADGQSALASLRTAQRATGAFSDDVAEHAVALWAIAEAAAHAPGDAPLAQSRKKAVDYLAGLAHNDGWPSRTGGPTDAETTRWVLLVLGSIQPAAVRSTPMPTGEPSPQYRQLRASLDAAKKGEKPPNNAGQSPFDRLLLTIGRGHLKVVRV